MQTCPCGNERPLEACCGLFLEGTTYPATAEQLMRSRFTAYVLGNIDYIFATEEDARREVIENWAQTTKFKQLRVLACHLGSEDDESGTVTFEADFETRGQSGTHRETSYFRKLDGRWLLISGRHNPHRTASKIGRNDLCHCGSGKKFKKCCGH